MTRKRLDTESSWSLQRIARSLQRPVQYLRRRRVWLVVAGLVLLAGVVILVLSLERPDEDPEVVGCEECGPEVTELCAQAEPLPDRSRNSGVSEDGLVQLDQKFTSGGTTGGYHLFTRGVDFDEPVGVVVRLHGDGAAEYDSPEGRVNCLAEVAASHNMILLAPRSPDGTGERTWWGDISGNLPWLLALVDEQVLEAYPADEDTVWWMGYSGGAEMISYGLLPRTPQVVTGGAIMVGGGGDPSRLREEPTQMQLESLPLTWITGTEDDGTSQAAPFDALEAAQEGSAWYRSLGFQQVTATFPQGEDHFSLPQAQILNESLAGEPGD